MDNTTLIIAALLAVVVSALALVTCGTKQARARNYGGTVEIAVPPGQKVINTTWKEANFWYSYRPMRPDEKPEVITVQESSTYGAFEGKVILRESR